jgi:hypothetical protein
MHTVANMVGIDKINKWSTALGLGKERHRSAE